MAIYITFLLKDEEGLKLKRLAKDRGVSVSSLVRSIVLQYLNHQA